MRGRRSDDRGGHLKVKGAPCAEGGDKPRFEGEQPSPLCRPHALLDNGTRRAAVCRARREHLQARRGAHGV